MTSKKILAVCNLSPQLIIIAKYEVSLLTLFTLDLHNKVWSKVHEQLFDIENLHIVSISETRFAIFSFSSSNSIVGAYKVHCDSPSSVSLSPITFVVSPTTATVDIDFNCSAQSFVLFTGTEIFISGRIADDQCEAAATMTITLIDRPLTLTTDAGPLKNFWNTESERFRRCYRNSFLPTSTTFLVETKAISSSLSSFSWMTINFEEKKAVLLWRQPMMSTHTACLLFALPRYSTTSTDRNEYAILAGDTSLALCNSAGILHLFDIGVAFPIISLSVACIASSKVELVCGSTHGTFKSVCFDVYSKSLQKVADFNENLSKSPFSGRLNVTEEIFVVTNQQIINSNCHFFMVIVGSPTCGYSFLFHRDMLRLFSPSTLSSMHYNLAMTGTAVDCVHTHPHHSQSITTCQTTGKLTVLQQWKSCLPFVHEASIDLDLPSTPIDDFSLVFAGNIATDIHRIYFTSHRNQMNSLLQWNSTTNEVTAIASTAAISHETRGSFLTHFQLASTAVIIEIFEFAILAIDSTNNCSNIWSLSVSELASKSKNAKSANKDKISRINHASYFHHHLTLYCGKVAITCEISNSCCQSVTIAETELEVSFTSSLIHDNQQVEFEAISYWDSQDCLIRCYDCQHEQLIEQQWKVFEFKTLIRSLTLYSVDNTNCALFVAVDVDGNLRLALLTFCADHLQIAKIGVVAGDRELCVDSYVKQISLLASSSTSLTQESNSNRHSVMTFVVSTEQSSYLLHVSLNVLAVGQSSVHLELCSLNDQSLVILPSQLPHKAKIILLPGMSFDIAITPTATWTGSNNSLIIGSIDMSQEPRSVVTGCTSAVERHSCSYFNQVESCLYSISWNESNNQVLTVYDQQNLREIKHLVLLPSTLPLLVACPKAVAFYVTHYPTHPLMEDEVMLKIQTPLCLFLYELIPTHDVNHPFESVILVFFTLWNQPIDQFTVINRLTWKLPVDLYKQAPIINTIGSRHVLMLTANGELTVIGWMMVVEQQEGALELQRLCTAYSKMVANDKNEDKFLMKVEGEFCLITKPGHGLELYRLFDNGGRDLVHCSLELLWKVVDTSRFENIFLLPWFDHETEIWCLKILGFVQGKACAYYIYSLLMGSEDRMFSESQTRQAVVPLPSDHTLTRKTCIEMQVQHIIDFENWKDEIRLDELLQHCDILFE